MERIPKRRAREMFLRENVRPSFTRFLLFPTRLSFSTICPAVRVSAGERCQRREKIWQNAFHSGSNGGTEGNGKVLARVETGWSIRFLRHGLVANARFFPDFNSVRLDKADQAPNSVLSNFYVSVFGAEKFIYASVY